MTERKKPDAAVAPTTDEVGKIESLHGADRSGLGENGWAEVPADLVGGHPELETAPPPGEQSGLNGPQPETDLVTGAVKTEASDGSGSGR